MLQVGSAFPYHGQSFVVGKFRLVFADDDDKQVAYLLDGLFNQLGRAVAGDYLLRCGCLEPALSGIDSIFSVRHRFPGE